MKLETEAGQSEFLAPLLEEGRRDRLDPPKTRRKSAFILLAAAFLTGVLATRTASYFFTTSARHRSSIAETSRIAEEHQLGHSWDGYTSKWLGKSDSANGDYNDRERWRRYMDIGPKRRVIPHPSLKLAGHGISPVRPADVCVMSSDSRAVDQSFNGDGHISLNAAATYSHMSWALRHGYRYRRMAGRDVWKTDRRPTWTKVPELLEATKVCQWTVFFDSDMFMNEPSWSLDDMRIALGIHDAAVFYTADDPGVLENIHYPNTGFFIVQNSPISINALEHFVNCAEEFPGCDRWRWDWPNEQGAFENHIAHQFLEAGNNYIRGDCEMTNGYWDVQDLYRSPRQSCNGKITAHPWWWKGEVGNAVRRLAGLDLMRAMLEIFHERPDLRNRFSANQSVVSLKNNARAMYTAEIFQKAGAAPDLIGQVDPQIVPPVDEPSTCVVAVDLHLVSEEIHKTDKGWAFDLDGTTATSLIQMGYALRHAYQFRRVMEPHFAEHDMHAYWHAMKPLSRAVEVCEWTMYYSQPVYPLKIHESLHSLLEDWQVPSEVDMIFLADKENNTLADMTFALIRRSPESLKAMKLLLECEDREECKALFHGPYNSQSRGSFTAGVHDLRDAFNQVIRPDLAPEKVFIVPRCSEGQTTGCNSQISVPEDPLWYLDYTSWSRAITKPIQELMGREALAYLSTVWQSDPLRTNAFNVTN